MVEEKKRLEIQSIAPRCCGGFGHPLRVWQDLDVDYAITGENSTESVPSRACAADAKEERRRRRRLAAEKNPVVVEVVEVERTEEERGGAGRAALLAPAAAAVFPALAVAGAGCAPARARESSIVVVGQLRSLKKKSERSQRNKEKSEKRDFGSSKDRTSFFLCQSCCFFLALHPLFSFLFFPDLSFRSRPSPPPRAAPLSFVQTPATPCDLSRGVSPVALLRARAAAASASKVKRGGEEGEESSKANGKKEKRAFRPCFGVVAERMILLLARRSTLCLCSSRALERAELDVRATPMRGNARSRGRKPSKKGGDWTALKRRRGGVFFSPRLVSQFFSLGLRRSPRKRHPRRPASRALFAPHASAIACGVHPHPCHR